jgi:hypothetical protein
MYIQENLIEQPGIGAKIACKSPWSPWDKDMPAIGGVLSRASRSAASAWMAGRPVIMAGRAKSERRANRCMFASRSEEDDCSSGGTERRVD